MLAPWHCHWLGSSRTALTPQVGETGANHGRTKVKVKVSHLSAEQPAQGTRYVVATGPLLLA